MMNRAIGAIDKTAGVNSFGMLYQWGRKDPFTPPTTTGDASSKDTQLYNATGSPINTKSSGGIGGEWTNSTTKASNITVLTSKPSTYYGTSGDMITTPSGASWWNPTTKTLYDPCPAGYRVPPKDTYANFTTPSFGTSLTGGVTWTMNSSFFPASGRRSYSNGKFYLVGFNGYAWMSTPYNTSNGYNLSFYSGYVYPNSNYSGRSYGWSVRCISE